MANIMQNRIDAVLKTEEMQKIKDCINSAINILPESGSIALNDEERYNLTSLDVDNKAFVEDAVSVMKHSGKDILPGYIKPELIQNDLALFAQMDEIHSHVSDLLKRVEDLRRLSASEAYNASNTVYGLYQIAADDGIGGAQAGYDKMKLRYKNNGGGAKKKEAPTE